MTGRNNAFDLLRILLALSVLAAHGILIGGYQLQDPLAYFSKGQTDLAALGVMGFFALSGFLITSSFDRAENAGVYIKRRLLRILPGFWVCLVVTGCIFAPLVFYLSGKPLSVFQFTGAESSLSYIKNNFFLKIEQWSVKDVLTSAGYRDSLNGSLWSLYPEMQCYCFTLMAGLCGLFQKNKMVYLIFVLTLFLYFAININFSKGYGPTVLILSPAMKLYVSYLAGSLLYLFGDHLIPDKKGCIFLFFFNLVLLKFGGYNLISPLLIAMTLIGIFRSFEVKFKYDISYGIYIYSFPLQQLLYQVFGNKLHVLLFLALSVAGSAALALLSYLFVERPFIHAKKVHPLTS